MCDIHALADVLAECPTLTVNTTAHGIAVSDDDHRVIITRTAETTIEWSVQCLDGQGFPMPGGDVHGHGPEMHVVDVVEGRGDAGFAIPVLGIVVSAETLSMARQALSYA